MLTKIVKAMASTEPCTGVHGKGGSADGAASVRDVASTEPCTGVHGKLWHQIEVTGEHTLQRSRAPECTERGQSGPCEVRHSLSFNGAVHRSARKVWRPHHGRSEKVVLQRSRAPECTESRAVWVSPVPINASFNGAVHRSARKAS